MKTKTAMTDATRAKLKKAIRKLLAQGEGPATAAKNAMKAFNITGYGIQGDDTEDSVEIWTLDTEMSGGPEVGIEMTDAGTYRVR